MLRKLTTAEKRWVRSLMKRGLTRDAAVRCVQRNTQLRYGLAHGTWLYPQEKLRTARLHWKEPKLPEHHQHEDFRRWMRVGWDFGFTSWSARTLP